MSDTATASKADLFASMTVEAATEALPKRTGPQGESIPNPFVQVVHDSYAEWLADQDKAPTDRDPLAGLRVIWVPVDGKGLTWRETKRKEKDGTEVVTKWAQHPNLTTALYLLRQAAIKNGIGVRIVVDYTGQEGMPADPKPNVHALVPQKSGDHKGALRVRFLGQKKKEQKPKTTETPADTSAADSAAA